MANLFSIALGVYGDSDRFLALLASTGGAPKEATAVSASDEGPNRTGCGHASRLAWVKSVKPTIPPLTMFDDQFQVLVITTTAEARDHVAQLESERALALTTELAADGPYMHDLDDELAVWRHHYVTAAVTEITTLRAELSGANRG